MKRFWPLLILFLPGCTFFSLEGGPHPRSTAEMKDVSPGLYIVLAVFIIILLVAVFTALFKEPPENVRHNEKGMMATMLAVFAALVVLLLVA